MSHFLKGLGRLLLLLVLSSSLANSANSLTSPRKTKINSRAAVVSRLQSLDLPLYTSSSDAHLRRKINDYLGPGGRSTERMLGRANQYFPVFEYYLEKHGMPASLKYLAVAESMLVPGAVSSARAAGLWQLMPASAREMGLRVDGLVDERLDIHRSTEAAVLMLRAHYAQFGDWHLALAAYNCGPGRVRSAIRRAGGRTFYPRVKSYLPQETRNYVAAYVAAAYAVNYYDEYGLTPRDHADVQTIRVYGKLNFYRAARQCGFSTSALRRLNPSFVRGYVPPTQRGYLIRVPEEYKVALLQYLWGRPNLIELPTAPAAENALAIARLADFDAVATLLGCSADNLTYTRPAVPLQLLSERVLLRHASEYQAVALNQ